MKENPSYLIPAQVLSAQWPLEDWLIINARSAEGYVASLDIADQIEEIYGIRLSAATISRVSSAKPD